MSSELVTYLRESAARLREIAKNKPSMAQTLCSLATSMEDEAAEIESMGCEGAAEA